MQEVGRPHNVPHVGRAQRGLLLVPLQPPVPAQVFKVRASSRCLGRSRLGPPSPVGAVPRLRGTGHSPPYCVARFLRGLGTRAICGPGVGVPHCKGDAKSMLPYFQNTRMLAGNRREVATSVSLNTLTCLSFIKESVRIIALISIICSWGKNLTHETTLP